MLVDTGVAADPLLPVASGRSGSAEAGLDDLHGHLVGRFRLAGGGRHGAIGPVEGAIVTRLVHQAVDAGVPIVGVLDTGGADVTQGFASLHAWGTVARSLAGASGVVPVVLVVTGPCVSGPALLLGMADVVVMTTDAVAYVTGPATVEAMTGQVLTREQLGGVHATAGRAGVASLVAADEEEALHLVADVLSFLPANVAELAPVWPSTDPADRRCERAGSVVPSSTNAPLSVTSTSVMASSLALKQISWPW